MVSRNILRFAMRPLKSGFKCSTHLQISISMSSLDELTYGQFLRLSKLPVAHESAQSGVHVSCHDECDMLALQDFVVGSFAQT
eukprot:m.43174 g.43174  ORF g.43174 m.43174 type:complete len:83 (-) comp12909_c0_seq41:2466-2714(-)